MKITFLFTLLFFLGISYTSNGQGNNTFGGVGAGENNTGNYNTAFGNAALNTNSNHSNNAFGFETLTTNNGGFNCAFGNRALKINTTGELNAAFGTRSLSNNDTGSRNIAIGHRTLEANVIGNNNTGVGYASLITNIGNNNVALGFWTPRNLLSGDNNVFIGSETAGNLLNGSYNVFLGKVTLSNSFSTLALAGNDTNATIILADGAGKQRVFVHSNGNVGVGLGNNVIPANKLDVKGGVVIGRNYTPNGTIQTENSNGAIAPANGLLVEGKIGVGNIFPNNKVEITHGTLGNSGLRFTNLNSNYNPASMTSSNTFLSVNVTGDVVLQKLPNLISENSLVSNTNLMTSNVNNVIASANIVNSISNTINTSNQLITTVNGVASSPINLPNTTFTEVDGSVTNELQTLTQTGNTITLSQGGGSFSFPEFTDTDSQSLALSGNTLSISNGNSVQLPTFTQIPQTISQTGNVVSLSNGGGSFSLPEFTDTDAQSLVLSGNTLSISNGNSVQLPTFTQIPQTISQTGNIVTLSNGGGSFTIPPVVNTDSQTLSLSGNTLSIANGNTITLPVTSVVGGNNVTVTGTGSTASPFLISAADTSLYANNGSINQATTTNGNRIVDMNNSNIWFNTATSTTNGKMYLGSTSVFPNTTGNYKLFVEGGILTEKVKVALRSSANWADYVFASDYKLLPLNEVEQFITTNKHLPGVDSASELAKNGLDIAEMQSKQMEKIEELTLYIIEQNKKLEKTQNEIEELKVQMKVLIAKTK